MDTQVSGVTSDVADVRIDNLEVSEIDKLDNVAVREALESILRPNSVPQLHKNHGSHSNTVEKEMDVVQPPKA